MTTYSDAEAARQFLVIALRAAGLTEDAYRIAVLPPVRDQETLAFWIVIASLLDRLHRPSEGAKEAHR